MGTTVTSGPLSSRCPSPSSWRSSPLYSRCLSASTNSCREAPRSPPANQRAQPASIRFSLHLFFVLQTGFQSLCQHLRCLPWTHIDHHASSATLESPRAGNTTSADRDGEGCANQLDKPCSSSSIPSVGRIAAAISLAGIVACSHASECTTGDVSAIPNGIVMNRIQQIENRSLSVTSPFFGARTARTVDSHTPPSHGGGNRFFDFFFFCWSHETQNAGFAAT